jgi:carbamoyltransferase
MSPSRPENKDYLDARVKLRERFRPYCPSIIADRAAEYLEGPRPERFMITSFDVRSDKREAIPAVVHVDSTVRPQTVEREYNPRYWELIAAFGALTGEYAVLNTSFNLRNEPIICHPRDAIRAFYDSGLEHLILGNHVLSKPRGRRTGHDGM